MTQCYSVPGDTIISTLYITLHHILSLWHFHFTALPLEDAIIIKLIKTSRLTTLQRAEDGSKQRDAFKIQEQGFLYFNENLKPVPSQAGGPPVRKPNKLVELADPEEDLTLAATPGLNKGRVAKILGLASSRNTFGHLSLVDLVRLRLSKRRRPVYGIYEEFVNIRTCCNLVEEIEGEFFCDCREVRLQNTILGFLMFMISILRESKASCAVIPLHWSMTEIKTFLWIQGWMQSVLQGREKLEDQKLWDQLSLERHPWWW